MTKKKSILTHKRTPTTHVYVNGEGKRYVWVTYDKREWWKTVTIWAENIKYMMRW